MQEILSLSRGKSALLPAYGMDKELIGLRKTLPIFYSALLLTGVNLLLRLAGTAFGVYISGRIGPAGVGLLQLVMSVGGFALTAGMAGVRTGAMYLTAEELGKGRPQNVKWALSGCFTYSILCSGAVAAALFFLAPWLAESWIGDSRTVAALRLLAVFLPVSCLCGVMTGYFTAANRVVTLAAVEILEQALSMGVTFWLLTGWALSDPGKACLSVVMGSGIGACLTLSVLVILRLRERPAKGAPLPVARRLRNIAIPLAFADVFKAGISTTENLIVPKRLARYPGEVDPLAAFGTVCGMVFPVLMFPAAILFGLCELLIPELARCAAAGSCKRTEYLVRRSLRIGLLYGCVFSALMFLLARDLCMALYQNEAAGRYLRLYALLIPMLYCDMLTDAMTKGLGQQKACVRYNILTSFLDVVFLFILLPRYGMKGYFVSFVATHLLNFTLSLRRLIKISHCRIAWRIPLLSALATGVSIFLAGFVAQPVLRSTACLAVLGSFLCLFGVLTQEDIRWIRGLIRKK